MTNGELKSTEQEKDEAYTRAGNPYCRLHPAARIKDNESNQPNLTLVSLLYQICTSDNPVIA